MFPKQLYAVIALLIFLPNVGRAQFGQTITVQATYPGANANVVADTVAAPIEQQVNGVEGMKYMTSRCDSDGKYMLLIVFEPKMNLDMAQVLVQNRVALALPVLPDLVQRWGITVRKHSAGIALLVKVFSTNAKHDDQYLRNYARVNLKDELSRVAGVGEVLGAEDQGGVAQILMDPNKMARYGLSVADLVAALQQQNMQVAAGMVGQPPMPNGRVSQFTINTLGRLNDPEEFANLIVKTVAEGGTVRLKDVATVQLPKYEPRRQARLNGKSVVILDIFLLPTARPAEVSDGIRVRLQQLRANLPEGVGLEVAFDFTPNWASPGKAANSEYLLLDIDLPMNASIKRKLTTLESHEKLLREIDGVQDVLARTDNPFDRVLNQPSILVRLVPAAKRNVSRDQIIKAIRGKLETPEAKVRLRDLSAMSPFPRCGFPIDLAIYGPDAAKTLELANALAERLRQDKKLTDIWDNPECMPAPGIEVIIDREKAARQGVAMADILQSIQGGEPMVIEGKQFQLLWKIEGVRTKMNELQQFKVRNAQGEMIPLSKFSDVRANKMPYVVNRFNFHPMVEITANPAASESPAELRKLRERLAEEVRTSLPAEYRLNWLRTD